jgi:SNF2 family DNA or RNA helicase
MVASNTLEEQILQLQEQKKVLFDDLINEQSNVRKTLTDELLERILQSSE